MRTKTPAKSKIVCTIGPATSTKKMIARLSSAGMDVARINLSHGTLAENRALIEKIKASNDGIAVLCDIQGPRIRTGKMADNVVLEMGTKLVLTTDDVVGDAKRIPISYKRLPTDLKEGDHIFINDGIISLEVTGVLENGLECRVLTGGLLSSNKGVNLPNIKLSRRVPTKKDQRDLEFIAGLDIEYVAISFVENEREVDRVRSILSQHGAEDVKLISKIERQSAIANFEGILMASDGVMVARGDLGVETSPEEVPTLQKEIIRESNKEGKPVIVATQMLESMTFQPVPTRAEANDVFNAVLDGADALMLSGETSVGRYPVEAVSMMTKIAANAEDSIPRRDPSYYDSKSQTVAEVLGQAVNTIVAEFEEHGNVSNLYILSITRSGFSARMISKYRPPVPVYAATPSAKVLGQLNLLWGVTPIFFEGHPQDSTDDVIKNALITAVKAGHLTRDDYVVIACASSLVRKKTNILGLFSVKEVVG